MKLTEKQLEIVAKTAATVAIEKYKAEQEEREKQKHDRRLHNTRLLLKNYRLFKKHSAEEINQEIAILEEREALVYLESEEFMIESVKRSKLRTLAMVKFIDKMLVVYEFMCKKDTEKESIRHFNTIRKLYIDEPRKTYKEVSKCHNVHIRTVQRDVDEAVKALTILMFGVDGIRLK